MKPIFFDLLGLLSVVLMAWGRGSAAPPAGPAARGANAFAIDLYGKLRLQAGNSFFSPSSISTALGMTYAGARGSTAEQMASTLHFTPGRPMPAALDGLLQQDASQNRPYQLNVANALWTQQGYAFLPEFLAIVKQNYHAGINEVDFAGATEAARQTINAWVEKQTRQKIKDLLPPGSVDASSRLVLTNAIYFKGTWSAPFDKHLTNPAVFHVGNQKKTNVPMMHRTGMFHYLDGGSFQALKLPYKGDDLSMVIFLPKQVDGLAAFEKEMTADHLAAWLGKLQSAEVNVSLPRFKVTCQFSLKDTLSALGMPLAFSREADFSGIDGKKDLFISEVFHKAYVDVNEEGTEAAAATAVLMPLAARMQSRPITFLADHPFVFLILDQRSGAILFLGRLEEPQT